MNSGSSLKYNQEFGTKNRKVELSGEAYFEVSKKMDKHFIVHTSMLDIIDVGTVFNIKSYEEDNEIVVSLIEGALNISLPDDKTNAL
ncbi:MAG: FecR family protein [Candidatus Azobacteroides sp.]|nr:FecR family protein [Candidatus Azobacteroides sp.]